MRAAIALAVAAIGAEGQAVGGAAIVKPVVGAVVADLAVGDRAIAAKGAASRTISHAAIVRAVNAVGIAASSPFEHAPGPAALLFYAADDTSGFPGLVRLIKASPGFLEIHF